MESMVWPWARFIRTGRWSGRTGDMASEPRSWEDECSFALKDLFAGNIRPWGYLRFAEVLRFTADFAMGGKGRESYYEVLGMTLVQNQKRHTAENYQCLLRFVLRNGYDPFVVIPWCGKSYAEMLRESTRGSPDHSKIVEEELPIPTAKRRVAILPLLVQVLTLVDVARLAAEYAL